MDKQKKIENICMEEERKLHQDIVKAIEVIYFKKGKNIPIFEIVEIVNSKRPKQEWLTTRTIGKILSQMGLVVNARVSGSAKVGPGRCCRVVTRRTLHELKKIYEIIQ